MTSNMRPLEIYIHIPFCVRKCYYCDFLSAPADEKTKDAYMEALYTELTKRAEEFAEYTVVSVFVGGGTPSTVRTKQLVMLLDGLRKYYRMDPDAEITVEVNPGTADKTKLEQYRRAGVNRLSIGLQSGNDGELCRIGRIHNFRQFMDTYEGAVAVGFVNINVDVMSALPGQTLYSYLETLHMLLALKPQPTHISAYSLILEEGTRFWELSQEGKLEFPDEDTDRLMYSETGRVLREAGYERYEISNYAKPGFRCRHNCGYWTRTDYAGFGIGAASLIDNVRFHNGEQLASYLKNPTDCREDRQVLDSREQMEEFMFLGLRLTEGIDVRTFGSMFGRSPEDVYGEIIEKNKRNGLLEYREGGNRLALTERGLDISNYVMAQFLLT
ncbi:MAG: radical SAM family heme chaperone HemW [Lachnospiraceae bacterium]|nr:radical SAM family heme chaperone HemW [Lachnospiraceae bacterium]